MTKKRVDSENVDNYSILGIIFYANRRIYSILIIAEYFNNDRFFFVNFNSLVRNSSLYGKNSTDNSLCLTHVHGRVCT